MMKAYYNEFDPKAAAWLRQLIKNGDITHGEVDERDITEVKPDDIAGFDRVHFFAGIGTWDYCLNQSGWGDRPIWTASLPCQPFSAAGKGLGKTDERHLLPHFLNLVRECKPSTILGEQVAAAIGHGWLDDLYAEMEACGYAVGSAVIGAHSIGAPHIRQRLYWVAYTGCTRLEEQPGMQGIPREENGHVPRENVAGGCGMVYPNEPRSQQGVEAAETARYGRSVESAGSSNWEWLYCRDGKYRPIKPGIQPLVDGTTGRMVYSSDPSTPIDANATQEARAIRLKGYGNAIQAQTAIAFITAYKEVLM